MYKNKRRKAAIICGGSILLLLLIVIWQVTSISSNFGSLQTKLERDYQKNEVDLTTVVGYLMQSTYDDIGILYDMEIGTMMVGPSYENIPIGDSSVTAAIQSLFKHGYWGISKVDTYIRFDRWYNGYRARGIVYSMNGQVPDVAIFEAPVTFGPLSEPGWYYYDMVFE